MRSSISISPPRRIVSPGAVMNDSAGAVRRPSGPAIAHWAPVAMSAGTVSAAGDPLQRLPPSDARPWICIEPISSAASTTPGNIARSSECWEISQQLTAAPIRTSSRSTSMRASSGINLTSTMRWAAGGRWWSWTRRSVPPARIRFSELVSARRRSASSTLRGAAYSTSTSIIPPFYRTGPGGVVRGWAAPRGSPTSRPRTSHFPPRSTCSRGGGGQSRRPRPRAPSCTRP